MAGASGRLSALASAAWVRWALVAVLLVAYCGWTGYLLARDKPIDFYVYYLAAYGFARGEDVYARHQTPTDGDWWAALAARAKVANFTYPYRYPPLTAQLAWPLTYLPPRFAAMAWLLGSAAALIAAAWLLGCIEPERFGVPLALGMLLCFVPCLTTLRAGQVNGFLFLATAFALYSFVRGRQARTGLGVAVGTMLKLVPAALLVYLAWRRQWRAVLVGAAVIALLFVFALPLTRWTGLISYGRNFLPLGAAGNLIPSDANQSLNGFFSRLFVVRPDRPHVLDAPQLAWLLYAASAFALLVGTAIVCWPRGDLARLGELEFALVVVAMNLPTPYVWYYQLVLLLIPFFVLTRRALHQPSLRWMLIPLGAAFVLTDLHGLIWQKLVAWPLLLSTPLYAMILLWGLLAWLIVREKWRMFDPASRGAGAGAAASDFA